MKRIRWEVFKLKQSTKFTHGLVMKRMGGDDQMRGIQIIDQVYVRSGDGIIRLEVLNQLINFTYFLEAMG